MLSVVTSKDFIHSQLMVAQAFNRSVTITANYLILDTIFRK